MRFKLLSAMCLLGLATGVAGCDVDVNDPGKLPDVDVEGGEAPDVDVTPPDVDIGTEEKEITVPDVDVDTEKTDVTVPDVDVDIPEENEQ